MIKITTTLNTVVSIGFIRSSSPTTFTIKIENTSNSTVRITDVFCKISSIWIFFSKKIKLNQNTFNLNPKQSVEQNYPFDQILENYADKQIVISAKDSNGNIYSN